LLVKSGYDLDSNYESEKISNFKLPEVHREIGPMPLKRAIKVLLDCLDFLPLGPAQQK
jgi:hypothetical protein